MIVRVATVVSDTCPAPHCALVRGHAGFCMTFLGPPPAPGRTQVHYCPHCGGHYMTLHDCRVRGRDDCE